MQCNDHMQYAEELRKRKPNSSGSWPTLKDMYVQLENGVHISKEISYR